VGCGLSSPDCCGTGCCWTPVLAPGGCACDCGCVCAEEPIEETDEGLGVLRLSAVNGEHGRGEVLVAAASLSSSRKKIPLDMAGLRPVIMVSEMEWWREEGTCMGMTRTSSRVAPCWCWVSGEGHLLEGASKGPSFSLSNHSRVQSNLLAAGLTASPYRDFGAPTLQQTAVSRQPKRPRSERVRRDNRR
jgi:hypothetical protein